jgi:hypothetical protein
VTASPTGAGIGVAVSSKSRRACSGKLLISVGSGRSRIVRRLRIRVRARGSQEIIETHGVIRHPPRGVPVAPVRIEQLSPSRLSYLYAAGI